MKKITLEDISCPNCRGKKIIMPFIGEVQTNPLKVVKISLPLYEIIFVCKKCRKGFKLNKSQVTDLSMDLQRKSDMDFDGTKYDL